MSLVTDLSTSSLAEDEIFQHLHILHDCRMNLFFHASNPFWKTRIQVGFLMKEIAVLQNFDCRILYLALSFYDRVANKKQYELMQVDDDTPKSYIHVHTILTCIILAAKTFKATKYCTTRKPTDLCYASVCESLRQLNLFNSCANILCTDFSNISVANYEWKTLQTLNFEMQTSNVYELIMACISLACLEIAEHTKKHLNPTQTHEMRNLLMSEDNLYHVLQNMQSFDDKHEFEFFKTRLMLYSDICYLTALYARHTTAHCALACLHQAFADVSKQFSVPTSFLQVFDFQEDACRTCASNLTELSAIYSKYF